MKGSGWIQPVFANCCMDEENPAKLAQNFFLMPTRRKNREYWID